MSTDPRTMDAEPAAREATMRAVVQERYGPEPEDVLRVAEAPRPTPGAGQVLVRVRASSVDRGTWHLMAGLPYPARLAFGLRRPKFLNPGRSVAGAVEAVGAGVTGFRPGDEVFGIPGGNGSFAEYVVVVPGKLAAKPANLSFGEAAAVPISGTTALQALRDHGRVQVGEKVLVLGASGGVGSFAVQIAKALGAEVTGVASGAKLDAVRALGADSVADYTREDVTDGRLRYDLVVDTGGNRPVADLRRALAPRGRLVIVGGETGGRWLGGLQRQFGAALLSLFISQKLGFFVASEKAEDLDTLRELIESGHVRPAVERSYPLEETAAAIRHVVDGRARGKVVVEIGA
jgi:NADPH:quinone reductase-like Zn-dependent oxidoreductase